MTIGAIGDIHGKEKWKAIVNNSPNVDVWVFIGDYFDSFGYSIQKQISNFKDILSFKLDNPEKVILLFGNHDLHYIRGIGKTCRGYQYAYALDIEPIIDTAIKNRWVQVCYQNGKHLFTHAGLTKTWVRNHLGVENPVIDNVLIQTINDFLIYQPRVFNFTKGVNQSRSGDDITQGPMWVRPPSLREDMVEGVIHVVGHTNVSELRIEDKIILIDCLSETWEYLIIEDGKAKVERVHL